MTSFLKRHALMLRPEAKVLLLRIRDYLYWVLKVRADRLRSVWRVGAELTKSAALRACLAQ